jgi:hypothetical protein
MKCRRELHARLRNAQHVRAGGSAIRCDAANFWVMLLWKHGEVTE